MTRSPLPVASRIAPSLLAQLQEGVAALDAPISMPPAPMHAPSRSGGYAPARAPRTTVSVPRHVGERARRLALALTLHERREATLGDTLERALSLLEHDLRHAGASIPDAAVALRSGPRTR